MQPQDSAKYRGEFSSSQSRKIIIPWALILVFIFAFAVRIYQLSAQSVWWDEGISLHLATSNLMEIVRNRLDNIHPPLYFFALKGWLQVLSVGIFNARFLSVIFSWLLVPVMFVVGRRWFGRRTAMLAACLTAISAVSVIYAQEIRVYSFLPVIYITLLALTWEIIQPDLVDSRKQWLLISALGFVIWIGLHLHYITLFVVAYVSIWALVVFLHNRRWKILWRWLLAQIVVLIASLPWFIALVANWAAVQQEASAGTYVTDSVPLKFLFSQVWAFFLTGLPGSLAITWVQWLIGLTGVVFIFLIIIRLISKPTRNKSAMLLSNFVIPLSSALIVWSIRSFSHPRYVSMFIPGLIFAVAGMVFPAERSGYKNLKPANLFLSLLLIAGVAVSSIWGLSEYFFNDDVAKDDMRGVARYLEENTGADDLVIVPDTDYSLPFEYKGDATLIMPGIEDGSAWPILFENTQSEPRTFIVDYQNGTRDWQGLLPFALEKSGRKADELYFDGLIVHSYELDEVVSPPELSTEHIQFGPLILTGIWVEQDVPAGEDATLALRWLLEKQTAESLNAALRLMDVDGWELSKGDELLIDKLGRPANLWPVGEEVITYHSLNIPPYALPIKYLLTLQIYTENNGQLRLLDIIDDSGAPQGQEFPVGIVSGARGALPTDISEWPILASHSPVELYPGLALAGMELFGETVTAGENMVVNLLWMASSDQLPDLQPELVLLDGDQEILKIQEAPSGGRYPTTKWQNGDWVLDRRTVKIPPDVSGIIQVILQLDETTIQIGDIEVVEEEHLFVEPAVVNPADQTFSDAAKLVGFELSEQVFSTDETIPLVLYWESLETGMENDLVVFTHILAEDGHLIGQHDGRPDNGNRPITGWVKGEYIIDPHELSFRDKDYSGPAKVEIGFYDPATGERLITADGLDHFLLPINLQISNQ